MNNFVLSYSPFNAKLSENQLAHFVKFNRLVHGYYHPFLGTYVLKSEATTHDLTESFKGLFDGAAFLLVQFFENYAGGALPPEIWTWINTGSTTAGNSLFTNLLRLSADGTISK